ncbi:TPA: Stealth CR1 domain-containing protein, partial [Streptococcus pneumoniae]|nr:Stealth CR1 domain-containing protein [Streptococcus pneumoniae]
MVNNIDFVVTWVNGNDPVWREEKKKYEVLDGRPTLNDETRYRDMDLFQYWFRAVEK